MYSCSNFFYCQNVGSNSHFFVLCTSCTLHECLADLLYKRQGGKGSKCLVAHLSNCEVLPPTKSRVWTTMLRLIPALALLHYSLAATTAPLVLNILLVNQSHHNDISNAGDLHWDKRCDWQWWQRVQLHLLTLLWSKHSQGIPPSTHQATHNGFHMSFSHPSILSNPSIYWKGVQTREQCQLWSKHKWKTNRRAVDHWGDIIVGIKINDSSSKQNCFLWIRNHCQKLTTWFSRQLTRLHMSLMFPELTRPGSKRLSHLIVSVKLFPYKSSTLWRVT